MDISGVLSLPSLICFIRIIVVIPFALSVTGCFDPFSKLGENGIKSKLSAEKLRQMQGTPAGDGKISPPTKPSVARPTFQAMLQVLRVNNCLACHKPFEQMSETDFRAAYVSAAKPAQSLLLLRLRRSGKVRELIPSAPSIVPATQETMPPTGAVLPLTAVETILAWIGAGDGDGTTPLPKPESLVKFSHGIDCNVNADPAVAPVIRLSKIQVKRSVETFVTSTLGNGVLGALRTRIAPAIARIPEDSSSDDSKSTDTLTDSEHLRAYLMLANDVSSFMSADPSYLAQLIPSNCRNSPSEFLACGKEFARSKGGLVYSRALTTSEIDSLGELFLEAGSGAEMNVAGAVKETIQALLKSPRFYFLVEDQGPKIEGRLGMYELTSEEIAARLTLMILDSRPSGGQLYRAQANDLRDDAKFRAYVNEILETTYENGRTGNQAVLLQSFREWAKPHAADQTADPTKPSFKVLADKIDPSGGLLKNLRSEAIQSSEDTFQAVAFQEKGSFSRLLIGDEQVGQGRDIAMVYGFTPSTQLQATRNRAGVLMSGAFLIDNKPNGSTSPVHRGIRVIKELMCQKIPSPDSVSIPTDALKDPPFDPGKTTRMRYEEKTSARLCAQCHYTINAFGFAFENYNQLGDYREKETIFSADGSGKVVAELPVNTAGELELTPGQVEKIANAHELVRAIDQSKFAHSCFAKRATTQLTRRRFSSADACLAKRVFDHLRNDGPIEGALQVFLMDPSLKLRKIAP